MRGPWVRRLPVDSRVTQGLARRPGLRSKSSPRKVREPCPALGLAVLPVDSRVIQGKARKPGLESGDPSPRLRPRLADCPETAASSRGPWTRRLPGDSRVIQGALDSQTARRQPRHPGCGTKPRFKIDTPGSQGSSPETPARSFQPRKVRGPCVALGFADLPVDSRVTQGLARRPGLRLPPPSAEAKARIRRFAPEASTAPGPETQRGPGLADLPGGSRVIQGGPSARKGGPTKRESSKGKSLSE